MKKEHKSTIVFTPHYGQYGKMGKQEKVNIDSKLKGLNAFRTILGVFLIVFLIILAYLLIAVFVVPEIQSNEDDIFEGEFDIVGTPILELEMDVVYDIETGLPIYDREDILFCVNEENPLPQDYVPQLEETLGISVDYKIAQALRALATQVENVGFELNIEYGYVSPEDQEIMNDEKVVELVSDENYTEVMAREAAKFIVPRAYESEMQTGLCIKLDEDKDDFVTDPLYSWLVKNSAEYGFIFRYTQEKEEYTLHEANSTVLRYVGTEDALAMRQLGMCLEQYIDYIGM